MKSGAEECDGADLGGLTCQDLGFQTGALRCGLYSCTFTRSDCSTCGNANREGDEECDGDDLDHQTCLTLGYHGGVLGCYSGCSLDVTDCARFGWCGNGTVEAVEGCEDANEVDWDGCAACQVSEFLVHPGAAKHGETPAVASPDGAESLVVWVGGSHDVELVTQGIYGRRFDAWSYPLGEPFLLNEYPEGGYPSLVIRTAPQVAMAETGQSIVIWEVTVEFADIAPGIYGRLLDSQGTPVGAELQVSQVAALAPRVAMDGAGGFVVVWQANVLDGDGWGIFGRRFDPDGNALGDSFQINTSTQDDQAQPRVAVNDAGAFIVSWYRWHPIFPNATARWYDDDGVPLTGEVVLSSVGVLPAVSMTADGTSVVVWAQQCDDDFDSCLLAQVFAPAATASGPIVEVNRNPERGQGPSEVCLKDDGSFVAAWVGWSPGQVYNDVFIQRMDASGQRQGDPFRTHVYTERDQESPSISSRCANGWVAVWHSFFQDGDGYGVYAQRYDADGVPQGIGP